MLKPLITGIVLSALSLFYPAQSEPVDYLFLDAYLFAEDLQQSIDVISWDFAHFYLDSSQLAEMLDLAISYNRQTKTLDGWLLSEDNRVLLELNQGKGFIGDKTVSILKPQWHELNGILYLGVDALKQWFGITANIRTGQQTVILLVKQLLQIPTHIFIVIHNQQFIALLGHLHSSPDSAPQL